MSEESYQQKFRARRRKYEESYTNLATDVMDLGKKWLSDCGSVQEMLEKIAIEQFLSAVTEEVRVWIREPKPKMCAEAGHWADEYTQARTAPLTTTTGKKVNSQQTHKTEEFTCRNCGRPGHIARHCRSNLSGQPSGQRQQPRNNSWRPAQQQRQSG